MDYVDFFEAVFKNKRNKFSQPAANKIPPTGVIGPKMLTMIDGAPHNNLVDKR